MKDELDRKVMKKFGGLRAKTYSYIVVDGRKDEKAKVTKKCVIKRKLKFKNYKSSLEATQLANKTNYLEKNKIDIDISFKKYYKEFIRNNKLLIKTQQIFKSERCNVSTEQITKIALSSNDDKRMESIDSIETYGYRTSKDLVSEKEEIKYNKIK